MRPAMESGQDDELERVKKELLNHAMRREWWQVVRTYKQNKQASTAKITRSGDTALHMAISDYHSLTVRRLLEFAGKEALSIANDHGYTPLHVAAYLGNARVCTWIANADPSLIAARNNQGETPVFLAVVHGRKQAFLCMHTIMRRNALGSGYCGKDDGRTILHSAISGGHFGQFHSFPSTKNYSSTTTNDFVGRIGISNYPYVSEAKPQRRKWNHSAPSSGHQAICL